MGAARIGFVLFALATLALPASADNKAEARQAYLEGSKYYDLNQFSEALESFKRAYWHHEDPAILFNIAQCHRALGHKKEAIDFYRSFLRKAPEVRNRDELQKIIADLENAIEREKAVATAPPRGMMASGDKSAEPARKTVEPISSAPPPAQSDRPPKKRAWVWGVVGGAVLVVGMALGLGLGLGLQPQPPIAADGTVQF
jgi:tetratricopeptide (TPR) repeat protein